MTRTNITGEQIRDGSIQRIDMDISTPGEALITKIIAGSGVNILNSTGVEVGTGDVTLGVEAVVENATMAALSTTGVPGSGFLMLSHSGTIPYSKVPLVAFNDFVIDSCTIAMDIDDPVNTYNLDLYEDPHTVPIFVTTLLTVGPGIPDLAAVNIDIPLPAGNYGFALQRVSGMGSSPFKDIVATLFLEAT